MAKTITPNPPANITGVTLSNPTGAAGTYELKYKKHDLLFDVEYEENTKDAIGDLSPVNTYWQCPAPWLSLDSSKKKFGNKSLKIVSPHIATGESFTLTLFDNSSLYQDALDLPEGTLIAIIAIHLPNSMVGVEEFIISPLEEDAQLNWIYPENTTSGTIANIVSKMSDPDSDAYPLVSVESDTVDTITITAKQDIIVFAVNGLYFTSSICPSSGFSYESVAIPVEGMTSVAHYYPTEDINVPGIGILPADTWSRIIAAADNNFAYYFLNEDLVLKAEMPFSMFPALFPVSPLLPNTTEEDYWIDSLQILSGVMWEDSFPLSASPLASCKFLSWGGGPQVEITADGLYTLNDGNGNTVDVVIDYSALSGTDESADIIIATSSMDAEPLRRCPACGEIFIEDPQMYPEPDRCPACGSPLNSRRGLE